MPSLVIANPAANRSGNRIILADLQHTCAITPGTQWTQTTHPLHATALAETAHSHGFDRVVAVGGDGTVHEVVNGLLRVPAELRPALAVVPLGTGNDFALGAGIFTTDARAALTRALNSNSLRRIDAGSISDEHGRLEYWDNTLGIGFDAAANLQARKFKRLRGFPMYLISVLRTIAQNFDAADLQLTLDASHLNSETLMLTVANGRREGGGFIVAPDAQMDDGAFDIARVNRLTRPQMLNLLPKFMKGQQLSSPHVHMHRAAQIFIGLSRQLPIHADGEIFSTDDSRELTISCLPAALRLVI